MSTETHVFFAGPLPSMRAFQKALKQLAFPFRLAEQSGSMEERDGYMPMRFRRDDTGVEFDVFEGREAVEEFADLDIDPAFDRVANFRWGGDLVEAAAGQCGAAALAKLVGGIVFDEAEDRLLSVDEATEVARGTVAAVPPPAPKKPGTRQADLKRYLKPLLELRPDLALHGRLLFIRSVRHLLRGVWFDPSRGSDAIYLDLFIQPLAGEELRFDRVTMLYVEDRNFMPLLYHCLRKHVFEQLSKIRTLDAYDDPRTWKACLVVSTFLSQGRQAADQMLAEELGTGEPPEAVSRYWAAAAQGQDALVRYYREKERKAAINLKIGDGWDEAPFPFEVSPEEREALTSEHVFSTEPWVEFDPDWRAEMPSVPGEIRFADSVWQECGEHFLVGPISPEEARKLRSGIQSYILSKRMEDGALIVLQRRAESETSLALMLPEAAAQRRLSYGDQYLRIKCPTGTTLSARFSSNFDRPEETRLSSIDIYDALGKEIWDSWIYDYRGVTSVRDFRGKEVQERDWKFSDDELAAVTLPNPEFDDYRSFMDCVTAFLMKNGYGVLE